MSDSLPARLVHQAAREVARERVDAGRVIWPLIAGPTVLVLVSALAYGVTGWWLISPFGFGVGWGYATLVAVIAYELLVRRVARALAARVKEDGQGGQP